MYPLLLGTAHHISTHRHETNLHCRPYLPKVEKEPLKGDQTTGPWHCKHGPMVSWPSIERVAATLPTFRRGGGGSKCSGLPPRPLRWTLQSLPQLPGARICGSTQQCGRCLFARQAGDLSRFSVEASHLFRFFVEAFR